MRPDIGKQAAEEAIQEITEKLDGSHMFLLLQEWVVELAQGLHL